MIEISDEKIKLFGVAKESIVDGPGIRYVVFAQGCNQNCKGCHNPNAQNPAGGYEQDTESIQKDLAENPLLQGITFSGGEPFLQPKPLANLARFAHNIGLDVIVYSGYTTEELLEKSRNDFAVRELLNQTDILVDGQFVLSERSLNLKFRGSKNQRIIDAKASLHQNKAVLSRF